MHETRSHERTALEVNRTDFDSATSFFLHILVYFQSYMHEGFYTKNTYVGTYFGSDGTHMSFVCIRLGWTLSYVKRLLSGKLCVAYNVQYFLYTLQVQ